MYRGRDLGQHSEANQDTMFLLSDSSGSSARTNTSISGDESYKPGRFSIFPLTHIMVTNFVWVTISHLAV